jgi:hypothetical protein
MTAAGADALNQELPQLIRERTQLSLRQTPQIGRHLDGFQQRI